MMTYIFLTRNRENDIPHIKKAISYLLHADKKVVLLLFPEGTDLNKKNLARSKEFTSEKKIREYVVSYSFLSLIASSHTHFLYSMLFFKVHTSIVP